MNLNLAGVAPLGKLNGVGKPTPPKGKNIRKFLLGKLLEAVRYRFFNQVVETYGWIRLPANWKRFVGHPGQLKKSVIQQLKGKVVLIEPKKEIDLIQVDNSPKNPSPTQESAEQSREDLRTLIEEYLTLKGSEFSKETLERLKEIREKHPKFERVYKRLRRLPTCSRTGHLGIKGNPEGEYELTYHPHRCGSLVCPVCGFYESREKYRKVFDLLKLFVDLEGSRLAFATFTAKSFENPTEAVEFMFKVRQRIYNLNFSKHLLEKIRPFIAREVLSFYHNLKRKKGQEYARKRVEIEIKRIKRFISDISKRVEERKRTTKKVRIADLFPSIWKFEIHKTEKGWHPHWHTILGEFVSKTLLVAFWKYITKGRGEIADIRRLKGHKAIAEISKYETKPVNSKLTNLERLWEDKKVIQSNGVEVSLVELFEMELALYGRQKITVWGKWKTLEGEEEKEETTKGEEKVIPLWFVGVKTDRPMFHIPKAVREAKRKGKEIFVSRCRVDFPEFLESHIEAQLRFEGEIYAQGNGELKVRIEFENEEEQQWFEELIERAIEWFESGRSRKSEESFIYDPVEEGVDLPDHLREQIDFL